MTTPTNATLQVMAQHRSIRHYTEEPIDEAEVRAAFAAAQQAATSANVQAYSVIRIRDEAKRRALVGLTGGQEKVAQAAAFFVICADQRRHQLLCRQAGAAYNVRFEAFLVAIIDATLFAQNFVLALESLGWGTCYIGGLRNDLPAVDRLLSIPAGVFPLYGLCVGRPADAPAVKPRLGVDAVLFDDAYPDDADVLAGVGAYDDVCRAYTRAHRGGERDWSGEMAKKFIEPVRPAVAEYYRSKGARLD